MPTVVCQNCNQPFETPQWRLNQGKGKYCGRDCANDAMKGYHSQYPAEYMAYYDAKRRCNNPYHLTNKIHYKDKGIKFLFNCFQEFIEHIGPRPDGTSLDRIDNNGNYEIGNVRWATPKQQAQNKSNNLIFELNGEAMCSCDWDDRLGLARGTVARRIFKYKWSIEKALTTPSRKVVVLPA